MAQELAELRDQITHHETMAAHHTHLATSLRIQFETLSGGDSPVDWGKGLLKKRPTKSHGRWVAWLKTNGPASRATIAESEGLLTGDVPPYADTLGLTMVELADASFPDDMMMRLSAENRSGKGRPVDVYFLWSQRFNVKPLFGVGPERPDPKAMLGVVLPEPTEVATPEAEAAYDDWSSQPCEQRYQTGGVVNAETPPILSEGCTYVLPEPTQEDPPEQTMETWRIDHATVLSLAAQGIKPTAEQFALLRSTCPDGADAANLAVAMAARGSRPELD